jgi:biopolymer transport protein TolR
MDAGGKKGGVKSDINVTPLVDIVLVLLIIFIVITPAVNDSVKLPLAKHSEKVAPPQNGVKYLTLYLSAERNAKGDVTGSGPVTIDDSTAKGLRFYLDATKKPNDPLAKSEQDLIDFINKNVGSIEDKRVFVKADSDLAYKDVNKLFQAARKGGADEASIVTGEEKKEKEGSK